ncbi:MAG TPA: hypothetical protein VLB83_04640 [Candidatus Paceibacterota bacterium]|nr:hypothetical protein [Candidatus Paceibacterota bacterium]
MKPGLLTGDRSWFLVARWAMVNLLGLAFAFLAWKAGWAAIVIASDTLYISRFIAVLFVVGLIVSLWRALQVSRELNIVRSFMEKLASDHEQAFAWLSGTRSRVALLVADYAQALPEDRATVVNIINETIGVKTIFVPFVAASLTMLGLLGTVVGAKIAFGVIDPQLITDVAKSVPMIGRIVSGLAIAIDTTIVGSIGWFWIVWVNYPVRNSSAQLATEIKRAGVYYVRHLR